MGFLLLIEVNFLGYQFAGHVGKIDSPHASPECWDVEGDGREDREMTLVPQHPTTRAFTFIMPKSNYKHRRPTLAGGDFHKIN